MSFNNNPGKQAFTAAAAQVAFTFNFKIYVAADIKVYLTPAGQDPDDANDILVYPTDYAVVIDGDDGGTITLASGATLNDTIVINRDLPVTRDISYVTQGDLLADTINDDQEYQTYLIMDGFVALNSAITLPNSAVGVSTKLPAVTPDSYLRWNTAGDAIENDTTLPDAVVTSADHVLNADSWANEAEAEALTALSFAREGEDVPTNIVTSDGDGTFTYTPQVGVYSSLHYALKAATFNPALYALLTGATFTGQVSANNFNVGAIIDSNYVDALAIGANPQAVLYADGTIVGSTDNGKYVRYDNGVLICTHKDTALRTTNFETGNIFISSAPFSGDFPMEFLTEPVVAPLGKSNRTWASVQTITTTSLIVDIYGDLSTRAGYAEYVAQGRWK